LTATGGLLEMVPDFFEFVLGKTNGEKTLRFTFHTRESAACKYGPDVAQNFF